MGWRIQVRSRVAAAGLTLVCLLLTSETEAQAPASPPPAVTVETVANKDVAPKSEFIGRLEAIQAVDIRARVQGFLQKIQFMEGHDVKAGDALFVIEPDQYQAAVAQAQAQVESATATFQNADVNLERRRELRARNAASQADLDTAQATRDTAKAAVTVAEAQLKMAQLNLAYASITAPIDGRIGKANITVGNLVGPGSDPLVRVVQLDPIRVVFSVSERDVISVQEAAAGKSDDQLRAAFVPTLRLANGQVFDQTGSIEFLGNEVDKATGTIPIWVRFANPATMLLPGGTVFITLSAAQPKLMPTVPASAVQETRGGKQVLVVGPDNRIEERRITATTQVGHDWAVDSGLKAGETIVIDGFQKVRPGAIVTPVRAAAKAAP
jgi:membrane fusion protein, multidrug efflux system